MASRGRRPRQAKRRLPRVPSYLPYPKGPMRWRLGGPLTNEHEAEALAAQRARPPGRLGRLVLRVLGGKDQRGSPKPDHPGPR